ncbi:MAG: 2-succinyl-5-enolpyruvyl-6-hydroxy-3-cyclohexene-1-carboxylic-acid synthase [Bacteroidota bacterium]
MNLQPIYNIAQICSQKGLDQAILSPGSRNAPLTLSFVRHPHIQCRTISDERSAAFIALGLAQQKKKATILACTSGSAALNYGPAIAEAYFQQIPLLVLTADRPPEWIDQLDGQTIRQEDVYGRHVKKSYSIPADLSHPDAEWHTYRIISEAINTSMSTPQGPVHINVPFREPFYPDKDTEITYSESLNVIDEVGSKHLLAEQHWQSLAEEWSEFKKKLIVAGQSDRDESLSQTLDTLSQAQKIPIVGDVISNLHEISDVVAHPDVFIGGIKNGLHESLQPELLITFGKSVISKQLKLLLRKHKPKAHWHIQAQGEVADTFQSLTKVVRCSPNSFFEKIIESQPEEGFESQKQENYYQIWQIEERKVQRLLQKFFPMEPLGEFEMTKSVIDKIPNNTNIHLANSMAVRYANYIGLNDKAKSLEVFSNRGTSGIDGSNSTAVGASLANDKLNVVITGDLAFFYDRNAFWHNYKIPNLRVLLLNNHAGGIFRMIKGPSDLPELKEYFETHQSLNAKSIADEFGFEYMNCDSRSKLNNYISYFFQKSDTPKILELESRSEDNKTILTDFKRAFDQIG